jgi:arylsulfatase A-like enzyme
VVRSQLAGLADVAPTVLEAAGITPEEAALTVDGRSLLSPARDDTPARPVVVGQVGAGARAQLAAIDAGHTYVWLAGEQRELLLRRTGERAEQENLLADAEGAAAQAAHLRGAAQQELRRVGATDLLDDATPSGFRRFPPADGPSERNPWLRDRYYARWIRHLPEGWTPPPPPVDRGIPAGLPPRSDRSRYDWPAVVS